LPSEPQAGFGQNNLAWIPLSDHAHCTSTD
jgi:hypothetical protein